MHSKTPETSIQLLKAAPFLEKFESELKKRTMSLLKTNGIQPTLKVILVGNDPASEIYVDKKLTKAKELGINSICHRFNSDVLPSTIYSLIQDWNHDPLVHGILLQRPLPASFIENDVLFWIHPKKDVDGFHPENLGSIALDLKSSFISCTPKGILNLLDYYQLDVKGKTVCVIGRSKNLGNPLAQLLLKRDATLIHCHSKTKNLKELCKLGDFVFVAIGKPNFIDSTYIKKDAIVVDIGIHRKNDGSLCGDVDFLSIENIASAITPVPGGVGPLTIFSLMENTIISAENIIKI